MASSICKNNRRSLGQLLLLILNVHLQTSLFNVVIVAKAPKRWLKFKESAIWVFHLNIWLWVKKRVLEILESKHAQNLCSIRVYVLTHCHQQMWNPCRTSCPRRALSTSRRWLSSNSSAKVFFFKFIFAAWTVIFWNLMPLCNHIVVCKKI